MSSAPDWPIPLPRPFDSERRAHDGTTAGRGTLRDSAEGHCVALRRDAYLQQKVLVDVPFAEADSWNGRTPPQARALAGVSIMAWRLERREYAEEAVADTVGNEPTPRLGQARTAGSNAVMLFLVFAAARGLDQLRP